jgi:hypothetical protein
MPKLKKFRVTAEKATIDANGNVYDKVKLGPRKIVVEKY